MRSDAIRVLTVAVLMFGLTGVVSVAGDLDPTDPPGATAAYSLLDLYLRLTTGAPGLPATFTEPASGPDTPTMYSLEQIMSVAPEQDNSSGAWRSDVLIDQTYWGLRAGRWGLHTGTMPNRGAVSITPTTTSVTVSAGYHNGSGSVAGDADLIPANIKSGEEIFGVAGTLQSCNGNAGSGTNCTSTCDCQAGLVCVDVRADLALGDDRLADCVSLFTPPPHFPIRDTRCRTWSAVTTAVSGDSDCVNLMIHGRHPFTHIIPAH